MNLRIRRLEPDTPEAELAARWRYEAFFADGSDTFETSRAALLTFLRQQDGYEIGLLAECDGQPAGLCLFVRDEAEPNPRPDLTPWLAALYVAPAFRARGMGAALVRAIEDHARAVGTTTLYLYTSEAERFYARIGWRVRDRFTQNGEALALMARELE
jgi:GNAT superfamily N-acetyltransferase